MPFWLTLTIQILATVGAVLVTLWGFWRFVVRPYLDARVAELIEAGREIEPAVTRGVKRVWQIPSGNCQKAPLTAPLKNRPASS